MSFFACLAILIMISVSCFTLVGHCTFPVFLSRVASLWLFAPVSHLFSLPLVYLNCATSSPVPDCLVKHVSVPAVPCVYLSDQSLFLLSFWIVCLSIIWRLVHWPIWIKWYWLWPCVLVVFLESCHSVPFFCIHFQFFTIIKPNKKHNYYSV